MKRLSRSNALKIAAGLSFLLGALGFIFALPFLARGAATLDQTADSPPYIIVLSGFVFAIMRLIGAYGTWKEQRWGIIMTILANAIDAVLALPGIFFAPTLALWLSSTIGVAISVVIIILCLWRDPKPVTV